MGVDEHTLPDGQVWVKIDNAMTAPIGVGSEFHTSWCDVLEASDHVGRVPEETVTHLSECRYCDGGDVG
jgi:hypothetical protein